MVWWYLTKLIAWYVFPRLRLSIDRGERSIGISVRWRIYDLSYIVRKIRRGWYRCEQCGRQWNKMAMGAYYGVEKRDGQVETVGRCRVCRPGALVTRRSESCI